MRAAGSVFAEEEARLLIAEAADAGALERMAVRRIAGDPLEQILGWAEFAGLRILLEPGVFVPRRRSEWIAELAIAALDGGVRMPRAAPIVVELCCGSAAIAAAVQHRHPHAVIVASDIQAAAVRAARRNLTRPATVVRGDLFDGLPRGIHRRIDLVVANAPYVPSGEIGRMPPEARDHEPRITLDGGADGLDIARRILAGAPERLRPGGRLIIETSRRQAPELLALFAAAGFDAGIRRDPDDDRRGTAVVGALAPR
ncbi:putative protein N(5)-glutamine methyltransferase [Agromyces archimandritae]|uniref:peptide chain release factor N(5)-glutamine methyltransferase n=1 Tax=Agromyces archimandritae TaxID=2781962 RepID=A0A975IRL6_9MICO|nr:putative protein N(5)-glutamine methyltransferase [Agromyces archimandritae]